MLLAGLPLILLPLLAVLQYRWIGEVSAAERDRLESSLRAASDRFASDFDGELSRLASSFQIRDGFPDSPAPLIERYQNLIDRTAEPVLKSRHAAWIVVTVYPDRSHCGFSIA